MFKTLILFSSIIFVVILFFGFFQKGYSSSDAGINRVFSKTSKQLYKKYGFKVAGTGGSCNKEEKETMIGIEFDIYRTLSLEEARKMIVDSANHLLENINNEKSLQQYLADVPFTPKNIVLTIYVSPEDVSKIVDPYLKVISFSNGKIAYKTTDPNDTYKKKSIITETYEEALQKLKD